MTATLTTPPIIDVSSRYQIGRPFAWGGHAQVYRGNDVFSGQAVAVKCLTQKHREDPNMQQQLLAEATILANLDSPNIVRLVAIDRSKTMIVLEFIKGRPLSQCRERHLGIPQVARIIAQVTQGLAVVHRLNLVHRDVKPANIMLRDNDEVVLVDFSIARESGRAQSLPELDTTGIIAGTVPYLSPEQARGDLVTCASDIFSLGLVTFELLTGRSPFSFGADLTLRHTHSLDRTDGPLKAFPQTGRDELLMTSCIVRETPVRLCELRPEADIALSNLLAAMLARNAEDRPNLAEISAFFTGLSSS